MLFNIQEYLVVGAVYDSAGWAILPNHQSNFCLDLPESKIDGF